jgi:hypothetical protein
VIPEAAAAEQAMSERIRSTWRLRAVDDDFQATLGRKVLIAGRDLRNIGMELKHVLAGPLDLNDRQFDVLRRTRSDTPPFLFQFVDDPWCFRVWPLREDALEATAGRAFVTLNEREAEAFTFALVMGASFPFAVTEVEPQRFEVTRRPNKFSGYCIDCGGPIAQRRGWLARSSTRARWVVIHQQCAARTTMIPTISTGLDPRTSAEYLAHFDTTLVDDDVWPEVVPPRDYSDPPLRPASVLPAARLLRAMGVLDRVDGQPEVIARPDLRIVPQRANAVAIVERVMRRIAAERGESAPSDAEIEAGVQRYERQVFTRIMRSPYIDEAALRSLQRTFARVVGTGRPGPFGGSGATRSLDSWAGTDLRDWDWPAIWEEEEAARLKGLRLPRCGACASAMWAGQTDRHHACGGPLVVTPRP